MKVTLLQQDILWTQTEANLAQATLALRSAEKSDLYILPEMFPTGFATQPHDIAEPENDGKTLCWMRSMASELDAAIAGSVAIQCNDGSYRNRLYFVRPDGTEQHYDKHHLFTYGGENLHYQAGNSRVVVEWRNVRFLLQVCYDLRFPIWSRNDISDGTPYDAIIYVASWPTSRAEVWRTLLKARAIENQCYVFGVNRIGCDPQCAYSGLSASVDAYGRATECPPNTSTTLTTEVDIDSLRAFRQKFPVLADRDILV